jgi:hypothetical protein
MAIPYFEPVVLFFLLGGFAGLMRSDLKIPGVRYESLSIYLLLAIGLKGGVELARHPLQSIALPALVVVAAAALIPLAAYPVLRRVGKLSRADAGSIAARYGSVSVVPFAVGAAYLAHLGVPAEGYMTVLLATLYASASLYCSASRHAHRPTASQPSAVYRRSAGHHISVQPDRGHTSVLLACAAASPGEGLMLWSQPSAAMLGMEH